MARYGVVGTGFKVFVLLLLVLVLIVGGILWFDYLNLINARERLEPILTPLLRRLGLREREVVENVEDPLLLEKERLKAQTASLDLWREELEQRQAQIAQREAEISQMEEELTGKERALEEREKAFNETAREYENRTVNLERKAQYFLGMPPEKAVAVMLEYESDMDIIDIFRMVDEIARRQGQASIVPYWISLMPPERGAELTRKMGRPTVQ